MKKALVTGAGGFIGSHLVRKLKKEGYWVRGVDIKNTAYTPSAADEFLRLDLREATNCQTAVSLNSDSFDEVYQLAADMGGLGFIHSEEMEIMKNNVLINVHMIDKAVKYNIPKLFFSSSVCIYRDMEYGEPELTEDQGIPAFPNNEYGWEKLYSELLLLTHAKKTGMEARIARFQNCYGPEGEWQGGREKAPAAICRKVALAKDGGNVEVWGDGKAIRSFIYIKDMVEAIFDLMQSEIRTPVNIGTREYVSVDELVEITAKVAGKKIYIEHIEGPVGVKNRNFSNDKIESTGWKPKYDLESGLRETYPWILEQTRLDC